MNKKTRVLKKKNIFIYRQAKFKTNKFQNKSAEMNTTWKSTKSSLNGLDSLTMGPETHDSPLGRSLTFRG